ncbi:hypothetical protein T281_13825 [Rhodomicrobium udaipurense JA643]|uniref:Phage tail protein n=1 Tax=Rhodomicrobium udaipurense TaxID=1202716 RepID=A0A8I1GEU5_9HYPH|nr:hypothetical protein [Rhodomicrobium udaipurense]KAI93929.1 hypothetical protein T281_13825 [Rhodomicrobium udaipurense JA643]MBJ7543248.1 hypothetical protein [Rhodomicrobium udaipurense]
MARGTIRIAASQPGMATVIATVSMLSDPKMRKALARAVNHSTGKTLTQVRRALVKQTGHKYGVIKAATAQWSASEATLQARIDARGKYARLKEFGAKQTGAGVVAAPWAKSTLFKGTFIAPRGKFAGNVYKRVRRTDGSVIRVGKNRSWLPIRPLYGPAIPKEIVKDASEAAFQRTVAAELPKRTAHELKRLLKL